MARSPARADQAGQAVIATPLDRHLSRGHPRGAGRPAPYQVGTAALYRQLGVPVVRCAQFRPVLGPAPMAKRPGVITVEVLPPIAPGLSREAS